MPLIGTPPTTVSQWGVPIPFEVSFTLPDAPLYPCLPHDTAPPTGITSSVGLSVDVVYTQGATVLTHPAYWFLPTTAADAAAGIPGTGCWKAKWAPPSAGTWTWAVRVTGPGGVRDNEYTGTFTATATSEPGYVRISPTDARFFEHMDGTPVLPLPCIHIQAQGEEVTQFPADTYPLARDWWQGSHSERGPSGFSGQQSLVRDWKKVGTSNFPNGGTLLPGEGLNFTMRLTAPTAAALTADKNANGMEVVSPGLIADSATKFRVTVRLKTSGLTSADGTGPFGLQFFWMNWTNSQLVATGSPLMETADAWQTYTWTFTPIKDASNRAVQTLFRWVNCNTGTALVQSVEIHKLDAAGNKVLLANETTTPSVHLIYKPIAAARCDQVLADATARGVRLKTVLFEREDHVWGELSATATHTAYDTGSLYTRTPATSESTNAIRWLMNAYMRYFVARWGWSPYIAVAETCNEADPYDSRAYDLAQWFTGRMHVLGSRPILGEISFFNSQPSYHGQYTQDMVDAHIDARTRMVGLYNGLARPVDPLGVQGRVVHYASTSNATILTLKLAPIPVQAGHQYRIRFKQYTAPGYTQTGASGCGLTFINRFYNGQTNGAQVGTVWPTPTESNSFNTAFPSGFATWTQRQTGTYTAPAGAVYTMPTVQVTGATGDTYLDDLWLDDLTTGITAPLANMGLDRTTNASLDTEQFALIAHQEYAGDGYALPRPYARPWVWGELYHDASEDATQDPAGDGTWWHKPVWAFGTSPSAAYPFWWTTNTVRTRNLHKSAQALKTFLSGLPLSSGNWKHALPVVTAQLSASGMADAVNKQAYLWVTNTQDTWGSHSTNTTVAPAPAGSVTIPMPAGTYTLAYYDTRLGTVTSSTTATVSGGNLVVPIAALQTDVAIKIALQSAPTDTTSPTITDFTISADGKTGTITASETLAPVSGQAITGLVVAGASASGFVRTGTNQVTMTFSPPVLAGQPVTLTTLSTNLTDAAGNVLVDVTALAATNGSTLAPAVPGGLTATATDTLVSAQWAAVVGAQSYKLWVGDSDTPIFSGNATSATFVPTQPGQTILLYVSAVGYANESARSAPLSLAIPLPPDTGGGTGGGGTGGGTTGGGSVGITTGILGMLAPWLGGAAALPLRRKKLRWGYGRPGRSVPPEVG